MAYGDGESRQLTKEQILDDIWSVPSKKLMPGGWLWWFWLFFIHDEDTKKTGKCRQIEILWSVKRDHHIAVNGMDVVVDEQITDAQNGYLLDGAAAAWYFDGEKVRENFVLERTLMTLDTKKGAIDAPGKTPSRFYKINNKEYVTDIQGDGIKFHLVAKHEDDHPVNGPHHHSTKYLGGLLRVDGTRIERFELSGEETDERGETRPITGTAYFQKIYLASPPPQWYWGIYHFADGSIVTYMQTYMNLNMVRDNWGLKAELTTPRNLLTSNIIVYHAPSKKIYETKDITVTPSRLGENNYSHSIMGTGDGYKIEGKCSAYAHACWTFDKDIGIMPLKSRFKYNEYPSVFEYLKISPDGQDPIILKNGWGNMENAWGFLI